MGGAALKDGGKWIFRGTDGFLCQVQYARRCSNAGVLLVPVVCVSAFLIFYSERLAFITTTFFLRGPVVDGLHGCLFFLGPCCPVVLTSTPAQQRPLLTPILTFSAVVNLLHALLLQTRLIPRLRSSFNVMWIHHAVEEEENQHGFPRCGFRRLEHA